MTGLEIEDLAVAALIETAGAEHLAAAVVADEQQLIRRRDDKRLAVGLLVLQGEIAVDVLGDGMCRLDNPQHLAVPALTPGEVAGRAEEIAERL